MSTNLKVYVAGPYSQGDTGANVHEAIRVTNHLADLGYTPYCPHLSHFWHLVHPRPYEYWLEYDIEFLLVCDVLLRLPGYSSGADAEVDIAKKNHMPVYYSVEELRADNE